MNEQELFEIEVEENVEQMGKDIKLKEKSIEWMKETSEYKYSYNFTWMGRPIIQYPQDIVAMQEVIWKVQPDLIIETGVAHGGSIIFYASMLALLGGNGKVVGIDIDIRKHNREEIEKHPMYKNIILLEDSSTDDKLIEKVEEIASSYKKILVVLDSNHTHEHVLKELESYEKFVSEGSYLVVMDTCVEDMPEDFYPDRPWSRGDNPRTAVNEFLEKNHRFEVDRKIENKLLVTVAAGGYLKCIE